MIKHYRLLVFICAVMMTFVAKAENYTLNVGENTIVKYQNAECTFTASVDGKVLVEAQEAFVVKHAGKTITQNYVPGSKYAYTYEVNDVKVGDVITISSSFPMTDKIRITEFNGDGAIPVKVLAVTPSMNQTFEWYTSGMVSINFNRNVLCSSITLQAGDYVANADEVHLGSSIGFNITNALNEALKTGKLKTGEKFKVVVKGLCDAADRQNLYNGDGVLTIEYIAPYEQHDLVKATVGDQTLTYTAANDYTFLSYFPKDGEDGLFCIEFDDDVSQVGSVILTMGNIDLDASGKFHRSNMQYSIEGNKVMIDARGTLRTLALLFPALVNDETEDEEEGGMLGTFDPSHLTITLSNVLDSHNNAFRSLNQGSVGSYSFVMNYKEIIDEAYIDGDNHGEGDEVNGGEEISLWLSNPDISFDAIEVLYFVVATEATEDTDAILEQKKVLVTDYKIVPDAVEGEVITFRLPEMADAYVGSKIRVALNNASSNDGMPHYLYIEFKASGVADAIEAVSGGAKKGGMYRLNGVKMNEGAANGGIYVVDGKKVYVK